MRHGLGHTPSHVVFHDAEVGLAFVGDPLFAGSIGRSDLPGGDLDTLITSITLTWWPLDDEPVLVPEHGPQRTLRRERRTNPCLQST